MAPLFSQTRADYWRFRYFGMHFQEDTIVLNDHIDIPYLARFSSITDTQGELMFYCDGSKIWNRFDELMPNGDDICQTGNNYAWYTVAFPKPQSDSLYYVISLEPYNYAETAGLYVTVVDMSLDNGKGDVISKGERIQTNLSSRLAAIYHENHEDIWLITQEFMSDHYRSVLITEDGISQEEVDSYGGMVLSMSNRGQLKISPDGKMIANSYDLASNGEGFDLFEFDSNTGILSHPLSFTTEERGVTSLEFSSAAKKLYVFQHGSTGEATLYQYDVNHYDHEFINQSRVELLRPTWNGLGEMQLGSDGKIYIGKGGGQASGAEFLGVINEPNLNGLECQAVELGFDLNGDRVDRNMPMFMSSYFYKTDFFYDKNCLGDTIQFQIANLYRLDSVLWDFDDNAYSTAIDPSHVFSETGTYEVRLLCFYPDKTDTIESRLQINPLPVIHLGNDTTVCEGYALDLSAYQYGFLWYDGSEITYNIPESSGLYWVRAKNDFSCFYTDSINLELNPRPIFSLINDTIICDHDSLLLGPDQEFTACQFLWNDSSTAATIMVHNEGLYRLHIINQYDCTYKNETFIEVAESPDVHLGEDTTLMQNQDIYLYAGDFPYGYQFLWEDGSEWDYHLIRGATIDTGAYKSHVLVTSDIGCRGFDTIQIRVSQVGVTDGEQIHYIQLFPNPCRGYLKLNTSRISNKHIKMYETTGESILFRDFSGEELFIDMSIYAEGLYLIEIYENDEVIRVEKVVVEQGY